MKKIKVIEESRFLSVDELNSVNGGITCNTEFVYHVCTNLAYTTCGGDFDVSACRMHLTCTGYASCITPGILYRLCANDEKYENIIGK